MPNQAPFRLRYTIWFNLLEGGVWCLFAALVLVRYGRHRRSILEPVYALSFLTFGLTDFREAFVLHSWLIWIKAVNLTVLLMLRQHIIRNCYPESKTY